MKRFKILAAFLGAVMAVATACEPEVVSSNTFESEFRLLTDNFHGGDDFVFRIYTNHSSLVVTKYECEYEAGVVPGRTYTVQDGFCEFRERAVTVNETHRGKIELTVKDPETGATESFSGTYTAYVAFDNYLDITNEAASGSRINSSLPCVVDGDDFTFVMHSNLEKLTLKDFYCEFPNSVLQKGKEYKFDSKGEYAFKIPKVSVSQDRYDTPVSLSLTFVDSVSGEEIVVSDEYYRLRKFAPSVSVVTKNVIDGDPFTYRLYSNRRKVNVVDLTTNPVGDVTDFGLVKPSSLEVNSDGIYETTVEDIHVSSTHGGSLKLTVKDSEYTGREVTVSDAYTATVKGGPSNISVDKTKFSVNIGESVTINISTTDDKSDGKFSYKLVSADGELTLPSKTDDIGTSLTVTGKKSGEVKLRIFATNKTSVYKDVTVFVRYRVALQVDGKFWPYMRQGENGASNAVFSSTAAKWVHNWHEAPETMNVSLVTWANGENIDAGRSYSYYHPEVFTKTGCNISADFILEYSYDSPSSITMFQGYRGYEETHWTLIGYGGYKKKLEALTRDFYYQKETTRRPSPETVCSVKNASTLNNYNLPTLAKKLQDYDDVMRVQGYQFVIHDDWEEVEAPTQWKTFNLFVKVTDYNRDMLEIKYIFYKYRSDNSYWWKGLDGGTGSWAVPFNE